MLANYHFLSLFTITCSISLRLGAKRAKLCPPPRQICSGEREGRRRSLQRDRFLPNDGEDGYGEENLVR